MNTEGTNFSGFPSGKIRSLKTTQREGPSKAALMLLTKNVSLSWHLNIPLLSAQDCPLVQLHKKCLTGMELDPRSLWQRGCRLPSSPPPSIKGKAAPRFARPLRGTAEWEGGQQEKGEVVRLLPPPSSAKRALRVGISEES